MAEYERILHEKRVRARSLTYEDARRDLHLLHQQFVRVRCGRVKCIMRKRKKKEVVTQEVYSEEEEEERSRDTGHPVIWGSSRRTKYGQIMLLEVE